MLLPLAVGGAAVILVAAVVLLLLSLWLFMRADDCRAKGGEEAGAHRFAALALLLLGLLLLAVGGLQAGFLYRYRKPLHFAEGAAGALRELERGAGF